MMRTLFRILATFAVVAASVAPSCAMAAAAGRVQFVVGPVVIIEPDGKRRPAAKGDAINEGDIVETGKGAAAQLRMSDDGIVAMRQESRLRVERYRWEGKEDGTESGVLNLVTGGFRAITGAIGRRNKENYVVRTVTAVIGVRGTDHDPHYIPQASAGTLPPGPPGAYDKVTVGLTYLRSDAGNVNLGPNEVGYASLIPGVAPVKLDRVPDFMRNAPPPTGDADFRGIRENAPADDRRSLFEQRLTSLTADERRRLLLFLLATGRLDQAVLQLSFGLDVDSAGGLDTNAAIILTPEERTRLISYLLDTSQVHLGATVLGSGLNLSNPGGAIRVTPAPVGTAGVAGGSVTGVGALSGGTVIRPDQNAVILIDAQRNPALIADTTSGFQFSRDGAALVDVGSATINGTPVNWGVYAGGSVFLPAVGAVKPQYFHFMGTTSVTPPTTLALPGSATYSMTAGFTKPVDEAGRLAGSATSVALSAKVAFGGSPTLTEYNLQILNAPNGRTWNAGLYEGKTIPLTTFGQGPSQIPWTTPRLWATCSGGGCGAALPGAGWATGFVIGGNRDGLISSYDLRAGTPGTLKSVTGSIVVKQ